MDMRNQTLIFIIFFLGIYLVFAFEKQQWATYAVAPGQLCPILYRFEWSILDLTTFCLFVLSILNVQDAAGNSSV